MPDVYNSKVVLANGTVLIDLTADTVDAAHLLAGYTAHGANGAPITGTNTFDSDTSDDTLQVAEALSGKTFHARGTAYTGTMANNGGNNVTVSGKTGTTIPAGYYDGSGKAVLDSTSSTNLVANNIREGITILGVEGTMSGSEGVVAQAKTATPTFTAQTISPDTGYTHLSQVTVAAITVTYSDNSAGGKTVTIGST